MTHTIKKDWWRGAVIYQIYPRSYYDSNGDGVGDLEGVTEKLDYVASLGVDGIWLSPFFPSPMKDFGYDVSDYCDVDPLFGSLSDFDSLVKKAHSLGLKVIIDQVISHTSDQHPWFQESRQSRDNPKAGWYVWADPKADGTPPNNWLSIFGGSAWQWDTRRCQYYMHNFLKEQPDINFHHPQARQALLNTLEFWLKRGVDGFRFDTVNFYYHDDLLRNNPAEERPGVILDIASSNPYGYQQHLFDKTRPENIDFMEDIRSLLDRYGATTSLGEVGASLDSMRVISDYTKSSERLHMCYGFDFMNCPLETSYFRERISAFEEMKEGWICWALSNHDSPRHISNWSQKEEDHVPLARMLLVLLLCLRGTACLYQGEELGLEEADIAFEDLQDPCGIEFWPEWKGRDGCRTPMPWEGAKTHAAFIKGAPSSVKPWLPIPESHKKKAVSCQEGREESLLSFYRMAIPWYKSHEPLVKGDISFPSESPSLLVFNREYRGEKILCLFNFSSMPQQWEFSSDDDAWTIEPLLHNGSFLNGKTIDIDKYGFFICKTV